MIIIFLRLVTIALLFIVWFFACATLWAQLFPIENVYWLARTLSIYGDENIYDLAAALGIIVSGTGSLALTWLSVVLLRRSSCHPASSHSLKNKHRCDKHGDDA